MDEPDEDDPDELLLEEDDEELDDELDDSLPEPELVEEPELFPDPERESVR